MIFSSPMFIFGFLPAALLCYYFQRCFLKIRMGNAALLCFSFFYYLYGAGEILLILFLSTLADYLLGRFIERSTRHKTLWVCISVIGNVGLLIYSKYAGFAIIELNRLLTQFSTFRIPWVEALVPIGVSFFTFQKVSYVIDVYRGKIRAARNLDDFALYVVFFPQLIAGPIIRFGEIRDQLRNRQESWDRFYAGTLRFIWGLAKKVMLANTCGVIADTVFAQPCHLLDTKTAWLGALAYTLQIYLDFSAYTDMAIGLGLLFGFRLPENFRRPYSAVSITDFWHRWHITLSRWFRDYLYIPLGGNRRGRIRTYLHLCGVFALCGMWHGPNWTFLIWGLFHGMWLVLERISGLRDLPDDKYLVGRRFITMIIVTVGWVLFRSENLVHATQYLTVMFNGTDVPLSYDLMRVLNPRNIIFMMLALSVFFLPRDFSGITLLTPGKNPVWLLAGFVFIFLLLPYCAALILENSSVPFIYFRF